MQTRRKDHHSWRKFKSALISGLTFCSAVLVIAPLGLVFFHVLKSGVGAVNLEFFTNLPKPVGVTGGGMANAIVGTLELLALASIIGIPVGVLGGVFLAEYGTARVNAVLRFIADVPQWRPIHHLGRGRLRVDRVAFQKFLRVRRRTRAGVNHDPIDPAHNRGSDSSCACRLSRSRSRLGHRTLENDHPDRGEDRVARNHHWNSARPRRASAAKLHRFFSPRSATTFGTTT